MAHFLVYVLFTFYIQGVLKFKCKTLVPKKLKLPGVWLALQIHLITAQLRQFSIVCVLEYFSSLRCKEFGLKIILKNVGS
jgi:hypothetical protein